MVDISSRFKEMEALIDSGSYFTINRARQFGKTTALDMIWRCLSDKYLVVPISFEGVGDVSFSSEKRFVEMFRNKIIESLQPYDDSSGLSDIMSEEGIDSFLTLSSNISKFTRFSNKPVVLTIDEVDKSLDNQLFLSFLGMLREKFLKRDYFGDNSTFHCVVLAGVYDVKNLKLKIRPDEEKKYNAPWNIAADFLVDMTFAPEEISQMLSDYQADNHTEMDTISLGHDIYKYTSGYPFLVSCICKIVDERLNRDWTQRGVLNAVKDILNGDNTLIDDLSKNLENNVELRDFLYSISVNCMSFPFRKVDPMVKLASMFSYIKDVDGVARIHNIIFEESIYYYFSIRFLRNNTEKMSSFQLGYVENGRLNMEYAITRFSELMHEEYRYEDGQFLEKQGRLIFLSFLKPIINGTGFYYVEPQTRNNQRMDLVVSYGKEEFIIELKIWRGDKYESDGLEQLSNYLSSRGQNKGYLVTFNLSRNRKQHKPEWKTVNGKKIFEAIV